ncbi:MAG: hypothetical protein JNJ83_17160 [Verrucomicrobiaceae bacterium]|nr:hypothetical protein [Verrucomicrobiaceae bacterium]
MDFREFTLNHFHGGTAARTREWQSANHHLAVKAYPELIGHIRSRNVPKEDEDSVFFDAIIAFRRTDQSYDISADQGRATEDRATHARNLLHIYCQFSILGYFRKYPRVTGQQSWDEFGEGDGAGFQKHHLGTKDLNQNLIARSSLKAVRRILCRLVKLKPHKQRDVQVLLDRALGLTPAEVAVKHGISTDNVNTITSDMRKRLNTALELVNSEQTLTIDDVIAQSF